MRYVGRVQAVLEIDAELLAKAEQAAAHVGKPLSVLVEDSIKLFLKNDRPVLQAPPEGYHGGSLERNDPYFLILAQIEDERHGRLPREAVRFD